MSNWQAGKLLPLLLASIGFLVLAIAPASAQYCSGGPIQCGVFSDAGYFCQFSQLACNPDRNDCAPSEPCMWDPGGVCNANGQSYICPITGDVNFCNNVPWVNCDCSGCCTGMGGSCFWNPPGNPPPPNATATPGPTPKSPPAPGNRAGG